MVGTANHTQPFTMHCFSTRRVSIHPSTLFLTLRRREQSTEADNIIGLGWWISSYDISDERPTKESVGHISVRFLPTLSPMYSLLSTKSVSEDSVSIVTFPSVKDACCGAASLPKRVAAAPSRFSCGLWVSRWDYVLGTVKLILHLGRCDTLS